MKQFVVLFAVLAVAAAAPSETDGLLSSALKFVKDCGDKSMVLCVKVRAGPGSKRPPLFAPPISSYFV